MPAPEDLARAFQQLADEAGRAATHAPRLVAEALTLPVGLTPKEAIWREGPAVLYRYTPVRPAAERHRVPLLLVYALINRPYIFDLRPERSFVRFMLDHGFDVYLLDWGTPGPADRYTRFDDYATVYLPEAIAAVQAASGERAFSLLGYCIGAVFTTLYAALRPHDGLQNLVLLTPPLDFSDDAASLFSVWLRPGGLEVETFVDAVGNVPASMIEVGSKMLKPMENWVGTYNGLLGRIDDAASVTLWQALFRWVHDGVPFAGAAFQQWIQDYLRDNRLMAGTHRVDGQPVHLEAIEAATLMVLAEYDHIVPPQQSRPAFARIGSADKRLEVLRGGHVGIMSGSAGPASLWPLMAEWLGERST